MSASPPWLPDLPPRVALRRETPADRGFAAALYAANRMAELATLPWRATEKAAFLDSQFALQWAHFARQWPRADRFVIEIDGAACGRLYLGRAKAGWHLIEIGLLPAHQRGGIGSAIIGAIQAATVAAGVPLLSLQVAHDNIRAVALYRRLGFVAVPSISATHAAMEWRS